MNQANQQPIPSMAQLAKASVIALLVALLLLIVAVLPAEYGIDPTGVGKIIGLTSLNAAEAMDTEIIEVPAVALGSGDESLPSQALVRQSLALRSDEKQIVLEAFEGMEVKAKMTRGESFNFSWEADGEGVFVDMHGEAPGAGENEFTTYWKEKQLTSAQGVFIAPFDGTHGWYWQNMGEEPVTVTVKVTGFYQDFYIP